MISVCIATFNGAAYIESQIKSILPQLGPGDEVIISDDGSTDETINLLKKCNDPRIKIHFCGQKNVVKNFANALSLAQGKYIFLADQDDIWMPHKVARCLELFEQGFDVIVSDCQLIDETGQQIAPSYFEMQNPRSTFLGNLHKNSFMGCCMAFNRQALSAALPIPDSAPMHDWWMGLVALKQQKNVLFLKETLVKYRRHSQVASSTGSASRNSLLKKILSRLRMIKLLARHR